MRALRIIGIVLGGVVALIVLALLGVWLFVNPNDYKATIERRVKSSTGRELVLSGPLRLSVFPWIALEVGPASLGNPPGFGTQSFASVQHAALRVKLLPLLRKQLEIGRIEIDGLDLRLLKNDQGKGNWQEFGGSKSETQPGGSQMSLLPDLAGVGIQNSRISYQAMILDHVNLEVGHFASGAQTPVKLKLALTTGEGAQPIDLAGQFDLKPDLVNKQYQFKSLELDGTLGRKPGATPAQWKFSAPELAIDLNAQTLRAPDFSAQVANAHLSGNVSGTRIVDAPSVAGSFKLDPLSLRDLMSKLGIAAPATRDPNAFARFAAQGEFNYEPRTAGVSKLAVQLDESTLQGGAKIEDFDTKAMSFDLSLDRINLDRYRSPEQTGATNGKPSGNTPAAERGKPAEAAADPLKTLRLNGTLNIGSAVVSGLKVTQLHVGLAAKDGVTHIAPARAKLYGGDFVGDVTLDDREAVPALTLNQNMTGVDVAGLLKDFANSKRLSGRGNVSTNLTARGLGMDDMMKTLNGHVAANLDKGAVEGIDLWYEISRAIALVQRQPMPAGQSSGRTVFNTFKASADLTNGVASTKDLNIASQNLRVTGQGTTNLVTGGIDYQLLTTLFKEAPTATSTSAKSLADIPVNVTGTLSSPKVRPDLQAMAKSRVQQEVDKRKEDLKQKLQDKLKDLFNH